MPRQKKDPKKKSVPQSVSLPAEMWEELNSIAGDEGTSARVREAVAAYLVKRKRTKKAD